MTVPCSPATKSVQYRFVKILKRLRSPLPPPGGGGRRRGVQLLPPSIVLIIRDHSPTAQTRSLSLKHTEKSGWSTELSARWIVQLSPPSSVRRTTPQCPTAHPVFSSTNQTAVSVDRTGTERACRNSPPSVSDSRTMP